MFNFIKIFLQYSGILAVLLGSTLANARTMQQEMKWLLSLSRPIQSLADAGVEDPASVDTERIERTLKKFPDVYESLEAIGGMVPKAMHEVPEDQRDGFRTAFQDRIVAMSELFRLLEAEYTVQFGAENRVYDRAQKISQTISACKSQAHDDFMSPTLPENMHPESCVFVEEEPKE